MPIDVTSACAEAGDASSMNTLSVVLSVVFASFILLDSVISSSVIMRRVSQVA